MHKKVYGFIQKGEAMLHIHVTVHIKLEDNGPPRDAMVWLIPTFFLILFPYRVSLSKASMVNIPNTP